MSLIPFILDLAEELHDFNRSMSMDVDEGFGVYPMDPSPAAHMQPHPHISRRGGAVGGITGGAMMWVPVKGQQQQQQSQHQAATQRHHPYRVAGAKTLCCNRSLLDLEKELGEKSVGTGMNVGSGIGTGTGSGVGMNVGIGMQPKPTNSAYSVLNRNGFQVSMNVKQFTARELTVKTINDCIVVEGQHDEKEDGHGVISRHFIRKYMLPRGYDPAEVHSTLSTDGILTVKAPPPPPPVPRPGVERLERMVDIQQISHQPQQRDAQQQQQQQQQLQMQTEGAASNPAPTPTPSLSVSLAESNGNGPEEAETETESAEATAASSPSLSSEAAAAAVAAVESTSNSSTDSTGNNGVDEPESMEVASKKEEEEVAKEEEPIPAPTPAPAVVVSSSGGGEEPSKTEDANANDVAVASNNGNGAAPVADATEDAEMPPEAPLDEEKTDKEDKTAGKVAALVGGEELAAVDAAILQAKNQVENGATAAKVEELAK
ncbi:hypothetical protein KR054_003573 [Drosophila jambulina]|nr:hypothetical protein KR054_003573 [Drosophila jambulina]